MSPEELERLDFLRQGPFAPLQYIGDYYGLPWPLPDEARADFETWLGQLRRRTTYPDGSVSRVELERFLDRQNVVPKRWMAARLGMQPASLDDLLSQLSRIGMRAQRYIVYPELIDEALSEDLTPNLPGLRFRTFGDHNSFCERLHAELHQVLGISITPLFCATSDRIQDYPRQFAMHFDCLTLEPVSGKHQMWLDFRKPLNLSPDRCSKLLYVENRETLRPYCSGTQEPDDLDQYKHYLEIHCHG